jgi:hypothetical protein
MVCGRGTVTIAPLYCSGCELLKIIAERRSCPCKNHAVPRRANIRHKSSVSQYHLPLVQYLYAFLVFRGSGASDRVPIRDCPLCIEGESCGHV